MVQIPRCVPKKAVSQVGILNVEYFSSSYGDAKRKFIDAASSANGSLFQYPLNIKDSKLEDYTVDVAVMGPEGAPALVTSSGVHGVEGFLGSAIQLAFLDQYAHQYRDKVRFVFIHALNPFGFKKLRRFNEDNVDLNRNFLIKDSKYSGAPPHYAALDRFLNPKSPPPCFEPFLLKAIWNISRFGMRALRQSVAGGQYEFPDGIFYGGDGPSQSFEIVESNFDNWLGDSQKILHVDYHSGLGDFGDCKLLLAELVGSQESKWYEAVFGESIVEGTHETSETAYQASGPFGEWLQNYYRKREYRFVTAEYGTYGSIRVLAAIRAENRVHHFGDENSSVYKKAKNDLLECFCPRSKRWREKVIESGLEIIRKGIRGIVGS